MASKPDNIARTWERIQEFAQKQRALDDEYNDDAEQFLEYTSRVLKVIEVGKTITGRPSCAVEQVRDIKYYPEERMFRVFFSDDPRPIRVPRSMLTKTPEEIREVVSKWHDMELDRSRPPVFQGPLEFEVLRVYYSLLFETIGDN